MAPAEGADALSASASRRRSGRQQLWASALCFGSRRGEEAAAGTPWWRVRRRKRTVAPVDGAGDGVLVAWPPADQEMKRGEEAGKVSLLRSCCFLLPARVPGRKHNIKGSSSSTRQKQRQQEQPQPPPPGPQNGKNPPSGAPSARQFRATGRRAEQPRAAPTATHGITETRVPTRPTTPRGTNTSRNEASASAPAPARSCCSTKAAACHGAREFGSAVGLSVVTAVSMAGLLGGRLWAVVCVCALFLALSRLKRKAAATAAGGTGSNGEEVDVSSIDYKRFVVLRGLLERDRRRPCRLNLYLTKN